VAAASLAAQSFEAASIQPRENQVGPFHFTFLPNRLDGLNLSLGYLIQQAFDVPDFLLSGPDAILRRHFDILATSGAPAARDTMLAMLRNLLAERFHLQTHWETRSEAAYRMVVLPGGPKMKSAEVGYAGANSPLRDGNAIQLNGPMSMRQLAERLHSFLHKPVVDATTLDGYYTIRLTFAADDFDAAKDLSLPQAPLPQALEEQLGLKLIAGKEPMRYLAVDHADAVPTGN
jgi:uncharacterized protein (TIGR03435 family)